MNQLYELKEIQSKDDLPKEEGTYIVIKHNGVVCTFHWQPEPNSYSISWIQAVHSYFSPVSVEKETVYMEIPVTEAPLIETIYQVVLESGKFGVADELPVTHWLKQSEVLIVKQ